MQVISFWLTALNTDQWKALTQQTSLTRISGIYLEKKPMWLQQKNVKRSTMRIKTHSVKTQEEMRQKPLFIRPCSGSDNFISNKRADTRLYNALLCRVIIQQNSRKSSALFPRQWQFLIPDNDVLWSWCQRGRSRGRGFPPSHVDTRGHPGWYQGVRRSQITTSKVHG